MNIDEIKKIIHYNPETGLFTWINPHKKSKMKKGDFAGCIDAEGYVRIMINRKIYLASRLAIFYMTEKEPNKSLDVDHINRIRNDNRYSNLRCVTRSENIKNLSTHFRKSYEKFHYGKIRTFRSTTVNENGTKPTKDLFS